MTWWCVEGEKGGGGGAEGRLGEIVVKDQK